MMYCKRCGMEKVKCVIMSSGGGGGDGLSFHVKPFLLAIRGQRSAVGHVLVVEIFHQHLSRLSSISLSLFLSLSVSVSLSLSLIIHSICMHV